MKENENTPSNESVIKAMELAWADHHHARNQTWQILYIVAIIAAGLITVDFNFKNEVATLASALLVILSAFFGLLITFHHRKLERRKFIHIMNCEEYLNLHKNDLIPLNKNQKLVGRKESNEDKNNIDDDDLNKLIIYSSVSVPKVNFFKPSTASFILWMHIIIIIFSLTIVLFRFKVF